MSFEFLFFFEFLYKKITKLERCKYLLLKYIITVYVILRPGLVIQPQHAKA